MINKFYISQHTRTITRVCMVFALLLGFAYSFYSERVPMAGGAGWDGVLYRDMCRNFIGMWQDGQISAYYLQKCLPFALVNLINTVLGISHPLRTLICLHFIALFMAIIAFFKISNRLRLNLRSELIVYALTFWQLILIKITGYCPYGGDFFAFSIALWVYYFFISSQPYKMLLTSIVGAFVWQSMLPISLILFALPEKGYRIIDNAEIIKDKWLLMVFKILILLFIALMPLSILFNARSHGGWWRWSEVIPFSFFTLPKWVLLCSTIALLILAYRAIKPLNFSVSRMFRYTFANISWSKLLIAIVIFFTFKIVVNYLSNPTLNPPVSTSDTLKRILWEPYVLPVKFCSTHLAACGLVLPLFLLLYKSIVKVISEYSITYIAVVGMLLVLGLQSETRFVINLLPFVIFPIGQILSREHLRRWVPFVLCTLQFIYSGVWHHINIPELGQDLEINSSYYYAHSDIAQHFFYYCGPWQGLKAYAIFMAQFLVIMVLLYIGKKQNWFIKSNEK